MHPGDLALPAVEHGVELHTLLHPGDDVEGEEGRPRLLEHSARVVGAVGFTVALPAGHVRAHTTGGGIDGRERVPQRRCLSP
ncbi:hypothetical protein JNUCC0626_30085 [Lentzea sp. JNUCC 0626]|uniref:hypothetical protein n=1 Tax=Lentzea sp. JNUCC 0626 TaxID=3367513 RepID=UPI00374A347C